jgi:thymidylate synthase (FAD)
MINDVLGDGIGYIELIDYMGNDLTVVNTARVSFSKQSDELSHKDVRLISYLAEHGHWSPFAHPQLSFRIKAPISVQRQWEKHRVGCVSNSESTRYVDKSSTYEFYIPKTLRKQGEAKQGSEGTVEEPLNDRLRWWMIGSCNESISSYDVLIKAGVAKEIARDLLPMATYTTWIWTASLATCARVYKERTTDGAQYEIGCYARAMANLIKPLFPVSWEALTKENG